MDEDTETPRSEAPDWLAAPAAIDTLHVERTRILRKYTAKDDLGFPLMPPATPRGARAAGNRLLSTGDIPAGLNWLWWAASSGDFASKDRYIAEVVTRANLGEIAMKDALPVIAAWATHVAPDASELRTARTAPAAPPPQLPAALRPPPKIAAIPRGKVEESTDDTWDPGLDTIPAIATAPGAVVVPRVGDSSSREGLEIEKRVSHIVGKKLPFLGTLDPADTIVRDFLDRFPWAPTFARFLQGQLSLLRNSGAEYLRLPPILLVGPKGCGKTTMLGWLSQRLGLFNITIPVGGTADAAGISAVARGWNTSQASIALTAFIEGSSANPTVILDELDKGVPEAGAKNGSVYGALLAMLQPPPGGYRDPWLMAEIDLTYMSWGATANSLAPIPEHLVDRFFLQFIRAPGPEHFDSIYDGVEENYARMSGIDRRLLPHLSRTDIEWLRSALAKGRSIRSLETAYRVVLGDRAMTESQMMLRPN